jgi:short-subunit dehydrogenase
MKAVVVTGASSGIGRALALRAARAGMCVIGVGRDAARLASLEAEAAQTPGALSTLSADVGAPGAARRIVAFALERAGGIDVLVNNAGAAVGGPLVSQTDALLQQQFAINAIGPIALVREAHAALKASRGHVIMIGSGVARVPVGGLGAYSPAKAALRSATAILRRELRRDGIAVTYVDPGAVDTPFMERAGMPGAPALLRVSPEAVARKILAAIAKRPREVNVVPWQAAAVSLGEHFPRLTDAILSRSSRLVGTGPGSEPPDLTPSPRASRPSAATLGTSSAPHGGAESGDAGAASGEQHRDRLEIALEPLRRRMERSSLRVEFVRELLVPGARLELGEVAMRWAGMPNKHERGLTLEVLQALERAGYLEPAGGEAWTVSGNRSTTS